ncbi:MAG: hypothetical protein V7637_5103 [Mycobacteriales bacterium]|jgi:hypothetical protein
MRVLRAAVVAVAFSVLAVGCSGSSGTPGGSASTAPAPEEVTTTTAAVAEGLRQIASVAAQVAAAGDTRATAESLAGRIEPIWQQIEGTVKANDPACYLALEDSFALISTGAESGDTAKVSQGVAGVGKAMADYLAKYPG